MFVVGPSASRWTPLEFKPLWFTDINRAGITPLFICAAKYTIQVTTHLYSCSKSAPQGILRLFTTADDVFHRDEL